MGRGVARWFGRAARGRFAPVWPGVVYLLISLGVTAWAGIPNADSHDERSYLLAADTFAHGRLTNPTPPMWEHLEQFHVLMRPTYQSKYPPGQGMMLALGKVLAGEAVVGAWIAGTLACMAVAWGVRWWSGVRWGLVAGLVAATHPIVLLWGQNYWGGSLGALGGALVLGGVGAMRRRRFVSGASAWGIGAGVLMFSRPYEGLALIVLLLPLVPLRNVLKVPAAIGAGGLVMVLAAGFQLYYDWRVTGEAFVLPYVQYEREYSEAPSFVFMPARPTKTYRHEFMRYLFHGSELLRVYEPQRTWAGFWRFAGMKAEEFASAYVWVSVAAIGLVGVPIAMWKGRRRGVVRRLVTVVGAFVGLLLVTNWLFPHYAAPVLAPLLLLAVEGWRRLLPGRGGKRWGPVLILVPCLCVTLFWAHQRAAGAAGSWGRSHDLMAARIKAQPGGPHLVIVRYKYINNLNHDWVANEADVDGSPIVWARDMGEEKNRELLERFKGRKVWLMTVDGDDVAVVPYPDSSSR